MAIWTPPDINAGDWTPGVDCGVPGGIDQYLPGGANERLTEDGIDVTQAPYNADNTGATNAAPAINDAIAAAVLEGKSVVYCPGTFLLSTEVALTYEHSGITIRGAGTDEDGIYLTKFLVPFGAKGFNSYNGGDFGSNPAVVSGTKTKGTKVLEVDTITGYAVGQLVRLAYSNMEDNALIQAGAVPTWTQKGFRDVQTHMTVVTALQTSPNRITIQHGLPMDATDRPLTVTNRNVLNHVFAEKVGFEDFEILPEGDSLGWGIVMFRLRNSWVKNIKCKLSDNRAILLDQSINCEVRQNWLSDTVGASSDGLIGIGQGTANLVIDNIFVNGNYAVYDDGASMQNAYLFNFGWNMGRLYLSHDAHPCGNLFEGNHFSGTHQDGYHGSSGPNTYFRNHFHGRYQDSPTPEESYAIVFNRFSRGNALVGNVLGRDGVNANLYSFGNPNIGNGMADGFAGPTGLSDKAGTIDYYQPGYGFETYVIQPEDIFAGDFWADWKLRGTVTARTDTTATVTMDSSTGQLFAGQGFANNGPACWWNSYANGRTNLDIDHIDGLDVYFKNPPDTAWLAGPNGAPDVFPEVGTVVDIWAGTFGFQERDLDVEASTTRVHNYASSLSTGAIENPTEDTLPESLAYAEQPAWWTGPWPAVDPGNPGGAGNPAKTRFELTSGLPIVAITAPGNGDTFSTLDVIEFTGTASDVEDGDLSDDIEWESSLDGPLGTGATINVSLSAGTHTITARATDSDENEGTQTVVITVAVPPLPRNFPLNGLMIFSQ